MKIFLTSPGLTVPARKMRPHCEESANWHCRLSGFLPKDSAMHLAAGFTLNTFHHNSTQRQCFFMLEEQGVAGWWAKMWVPTRWVPLMRSFRKVRWVFGSCHGYPYVHALQLHWPSRQMRTGGNTPCTLLSATCHTVPSCNAHVSIASSVVQLWLVELQTFCSGNFWHSASTATARVDMSELRRSMANIEASVQDFEAHAKLAASRDPTKKLQWQALSTRLSVTRSRLFFLRMKLKRQPRWAIFREAGFQCLEKVKLVCRKGVAFAMHQMVQSLAATTRCGIFFGFWKVCLSDWGEMFTLSWRMQTLPFGGILLAPHPYVLPPRGTVSCSQSPRYVTTHGKQHAEATVLHLKFCRWETLLRDALDIGMAGPSSGSKLRKISSLRCWTPTFGPSKQRFDEGFHPEPSLEALWMIQPTCLWPKYFASATENAFWSQRWIFWGVGWLGEGFLEKFETEPTCPWGY